MDTPRARSPRPLPPLSSKPSTAPLPHPPPPLSAAASPSHDFYFASASSSPFGGHLHPLSMSCAPIGRVVSDLSHNSFFKSKASRHPTTSYGTESMDDRDKANNRTPPFFSGLGGAWRKERRSSDTAGGKKLAEEKRKDKATRAKDLGQSVKKYMTAMVDHLRSSFYGQAEREHRRRPHSFSGHGLNDARETKERERWMRRRGQLSSAPASLRISPANSGHLSVARSVKVSSAPSEESSMEELQSAVEAAIAHCKNSISPRADADDGRREDRTK